MASNGNVQTNQNWSLGADSGPSGDDKGPRPPKGVTESRVLNIIKNNDQENKNQQRQQPFELPVVSSQLSADAQEFVPRAKTSYPAGSLSAEAPEFYSAIHGDYNSYGNMYDQSADYDPNYLVDSFGNMNIQQVGLGSYGMGNPGAPQAESTGDPVLDKFNHTLYILNMHPGNMEEYLRPICELIQTGRGGNTDVNNLVESLFEQSIQEANFRYTGARICQYLSSHLKDTPQFTGFFKTFMQRCQKEFGKREALLNGSSEEQERLRGLAMFMAEVFLNVHTDVAGGTPQRLHFLPNTLMDLVQCILSKPDDLNIKSACLLFKLSGALIEDIVKNSPEQCIKFEEIFSSLQSLQSSPDMSEDAKFRIKNVVDLKESNWGRNMSSPSKKPAEFSTDLNNFQSQEPVFFNHLGMMCSRVEAGLPEEDYDENIHVLNEEEEEALLEFEAEQKRLTGDYSNDTGYDSYNFGDGADDGGEMGEEVEAAFEEFLQEQYNTQQQQQQNYGYNPYQQQQQPHQLRHQQAPSHPNFYQQPPPLQHELYNDYSLQQQPPQQGYHPQQHFYPQQDQQYPGPVPQQPQYHQMNQQYQQPRQYQQHQQPPPPQSQQQQKQQQQNPYS